MDFDKILQIASILFGAGGIISAVVSYRRSNAQNDLDLSTAWEKFSSPLISRVAYLELRNVEQAKEIEFLNTKVNHQENEIIDLRGWAERLARQVIELGGIPVPFNIRYQSAQSTDQKQTKE